MLMKGVYCSCWGVLLLLLLLPKSGSNWMGLEDMVVGYTLVPGTNLVRKLRYKEDRQNQKRGKRKKRVWNSVVAVGRVKRMERMALP